ncbi:MAG: DHHW family protein [Roseburia sp.]|nr:DHHW family protein [Roseburia sp.]MCM1202069.1 DHHW family protein [Bacteroides fragilis]
MDKVKQTVHKIVAVFTLGMLFFMCCPIITGVVQKIFTISKSAETNQGTYPLENDSERAEYDIIRSVLDKIETVEQRIEKKVTSSLPFRRSFILAKKACDKTIGLDMTTSLCAGENDLSSASDIVLEYEDGYLGFIMDDIDISEKIESLIQFGNQMKNEERNFLFFMVPGKYEGNEIYQDYSEEKTEEIVNAFETNEVDMICLSEMINEGSVNSLFFKTDHHWLPSAGIWADRVLCEALNERYGYHFDTSIFDSVHYETKIVQERFLGSLGKKVTEVYCQKDDFPVILPRYDTELQVFMSKKGKSSCGTIEDTLLNYSAFDEESSYNGDIYSFYGYENQELITIHNNRINDGSNILMIKTSYANCMYPYLAAVVEDLYVVDLRFFSRSLQSYIQETNPDTVIIIYGVGGFESGGGKETFDFR